MDERLNIKAFGAVGDGVTDDAPAINAALERGGDIFIPAGEYLLGDTLKIKSHTHIFADEGARLFRKEHTQTGRYDFLLSNADTANGNTDISIAGGIWDGSCCPEDRGKDLFDPSATTGVLLNFRKVSGLSLCGLTLKNALCYYTRFCEAENVKIENIRFASERIAANQDGIHLAGYCKNFVIRNLVGEYGSPNDDFIALNADDAMKRQECFDTVCGPIENITVENIHSDYCHCFLRLLSVFNQIRNVTVKNITGRCRGRAINLDAARNCRVPLFDEKDFPDGVGKVENITVDGLSVSHEIRDEALIVLETNCRDFTVRNFKCTDNEEPVFARIGYTAACRYSLKMNGASHVKECAAGEETDIVTMNAESLEFNTFPLKKLFLIGDSIRMGYAPYVREALKGKALVYWPAENCRFAAYTYYALGDWEDKMRLGADLAVVHWNAGLHDAAHFAEDEAVTPPDVYARYIVRICDRLRFLYPDAKQIFATSTPVLESRYGYWLHRHNAEIEALNAAALDALKSRDIAINDLHAVPDETCFSDATHFNTPLGREVMTKAVLKSVCPALGIDYDTLTMPDFGEDL